MLESMFQRYIKLFALIIMLAIVIAISASLTLVGFWILGLSVFIIFIYIFFNTIRSELRKVEQYRGCTTCGGK